MGRGPAARFAPEEILRRMQRVVGRHAPSVVGVPTAVHREFSALQAAVRGGLEPAARAALESLPRDRAEALR